MSRNHFESITCPKCGAQGDFLVWDSINTVTDPGMKKKVRSGEAFVWTCPGCGEKIPVSYTTLYHQQEDGLMIYLVFGDRQPVIALMSGMGAPAEGALDTDMPLPGADYTCRVVSSLNELREKLMIFDAGLDDRVAEIMKYLIERQMAAQDPPVNISECRFHESPGGERAVAVRTDGGWRALSWPEEMYEAVARIFSGSPESSRRPVVVDREWASRYLDGQEEEG